MDQTVRIRKDNNRIKINFMYNDDLINIMREHHGYFYRKEKAWVFPTSKLTELYNILTNKHYNVQIVKEAQQTSIPIQTSKNPWDDKEVLFVVGICKSCGAYGSCKKNGLCLRCSR